EPTSQGFGITKHPRSWRARKASRRAANPAGDVAMDKLMSVSVRSGRMNHLSGVGESHSITAGVRNDDRARRFVGCVSRPVALKLQQHLYPAAQARAGLLQPAKRQLVAGQRKPSTRITDDEHIEALVKGGQR